MTTALFTHPDCLTHVTPEGHPERVARLEAVLAALDAPKFANLDRWEAPPATDEALLRAHPTAHLARMAKAVPESGQVPLDPDTYATPGSEIASRRAAGAVVAAVDLVLSGGAANAFCAVRPPGHHAERAQAMGFCFYSSIAVGALHALDHHGLSRVAVVDFDVHHGNGTQDVLWEEPRIRFASTHQMPLYPGTGAAEERGSADQILNVPLPPGADGAVFRRAVGERILPELDAFAPELVLISAGFDAHQADPLANLALDESDFVWVTEKLADLAARHAGGRLVSTLEGGYDLEALAASTAAHVAVLMERGNG
ncbi:MAG: histone deacetylase family protein [Pseudomonadota bacterium]